MRYPCLVGWFDFLSVLWYNKVMDSVNGTFQIPSFARKEAYNFDEATQDTYAVYEELNAIAEEIERCRLRNC